MLEIPQYGGATWQSSLWK